MRILHTGDLHLGKTVHEYSMLEEQKHILGEILRIAKEEAADALIIAGDIYDRPVPPWEAVVLFDEFVTGLVKEGVKILVVSGNHDSGERLSFAGSLLAQKGLYLEGILKESMNKVILKKDRLKVNVFLLPFVRPAVVRELYGIKETISSGRAVQEILQRTRLHEEQVNILVAHQFVTDGAWSPEVSDSENLLFTGGMDSVDAGLFKDFDYTALGHLHRPQRVGERQVYYAGSPLKYSFSEAYHRKSVYLLNIQEKGKLTVEKRELVPMRDMRKIRGPFSELIKESLYSLENREDYLSVTLTDQEEILDAMGTLRTVYPNIMQLILEKNQIQKDQEAKAYKGVEGKSPMELFEDFYMLVREEPLDEERRQVIKAAVDEAMEGKE